MQGVFGRVLSLRMKSKPKNKKRPHAGKPAGKPHKQGHKPRHDGSAAKPKGPKISADLFGYHAVAEAWLNPARAIEALYITENAREGFGHILDRGQSLNRPAPIHVDKAVIDKALPPGTVHQGLALKSAPLPTLGLPDLLIQTQDQSRALFLILDQVTDPHNVGAITRSACAFGANGIIVQSRHAPESTGILAKTACGALEHVPFAEETNLARAIEELQENGFFVLGLDERGEQDIGEAAKIHKDGKTALVLGAEGPGMRRLIKEKCDALVRLPMSGTMPSINVSNAASIALYALSGAD